MSIRLSNCPSVELILAEMKWVSKILFSWVLGLHDILALKFV